MGVISLFHGWCGVFWIVVREGRALFRGLILLLLKWQRVWMPGSDGLMLPALPSVVFILLWLCFLERGVCPCFFPPKVQAFQVNWLIMSFNELPLVKHLKISGSYLHREGMKCCCLKVLLEMISLIPFPLLLVAVSWARKILNQVFLSH